MLSELLTAVALVLVIEGLLPFVSPGGYRKSLASLVNQGDRTLRVIGLSSMMAGVVLLTLVR